MENQKRTFGDFADCYVEVVLGKGALYKRYDVLFDRYRKHSIKATIRLRCSKKTTHPVGREVPLPIKWQAFLWLGENKADLARFLSRELVSHAPADITIVVSGSCLEEDDVLCSNHSLNVSTLRSNHEEANTRFVLHAGPLNGHVDNVLVSARDTSAGTSPKDYVQSVDVGRNFKEPEVHPLEGGLG